MNKKHGMEIIRHLLLRIVLPCLILFCLSLVFRLFVEPIALVVL